VINAFVNVGTLVPVQMHREFPVQKVITPTTRAPSPAFPVHPVKFPAKKKVLNVSNVSRGIGNRNQNNQNVNQSTLDQSWPKEDLPRSSYRSGLKLMPLLHPVLGHAWLGQKAVRHPMNRVKIARLANPVPKEPPNANRVARESSVTKMAPPAKSAK